MKLVTMESCSLTLRSKNFLSDLVHVVVYIPAGASCRPIVSSLQHSVGADAQIHRATSALLPSALILCPSPGVKGETPNNAHPTFQLFIHPHIQHTNVLSIQSYTPAQWSEFALFDPTTWHPSHHYHHYPHTITTLTLPHCTFCTNICLMRSSLVCISRKCS